MRSIPIMSVFLAEKTFFSFSYHIFIFNIGTIIKFGRRSLSPMLTSKARHANHGTKMNNTLYNFNCSYNINLPTVHTLYTWCTHVQTLSDPHIPGYLQVQLSRWWVQKQKELKHVEMLPTIAWNNIWYFPRQINRNFLLNELNKKMNLQTYKTKGYS